MSGTYREIITLQLGHYSNFIGTHWWNLQVSLINSEYIPFIHCYIGEESTYLVSGSVIIELLN